MVGIGGLQTDIDTVRKEVLFKSEQYLLSHSDVKTLKFNQLSKMLSNMLYAKRFGPYFISPIVAGFDGEDGKPVLSAMDCIGAPVISRDFAVSGTCTANLYGLAETYYRPDLGDDELFEVGCQTLLAAADRDALRGWGGKVTMVRKDGGRREWRLKGRMD